MSRKISVFIGTAISYSGWERALEAAAEGGYDGIDFSFNRASSETMKGTHYHHDVDEEYLYKIKRRATELGLEIPMVHGHIGKDFWNQDEESKEKFIITSERDFRAAAILGAEVCVVHGPGLNGDIPNDLEAMHKASLDGYTSIIPYAEKYNVKMAMETSSLTALTDANIFAKAEEMAKAYDAVPTKMKAICVDTGHTYISKKVDGIPVEDFIRMLGNRVEYLHLHDNCGYGDDHSLPGIGGIKWKNVFDVLREIGYSGWYNYELGYGGMGYLGYEYLRSSAAFLRKFTDADGDVMNKEKFI